MTKEQKQKGISALKSIKRLSLLCLALLLFFGIILNIGDLNIDNLKRTVVRLGSVFGADEDEIDGEITYTDDAGMRIVRFKDGVAVVTSDKLRVFDSSGLEFFSSKTVMANPCVDATDSRILVFDRDANSMGVYTSFVNLAQIKTEQPIINASMNDQGYIAAATQADGYKSMVTLYNANFDKTYEYYSADGYILNTDVYGNGKQFACSALVVSGGDSFCRVSVFDTSLETPKAVTQINAGFIFDIEYINKSKLLAIADTGWYLIDTESGSIVNSREYSSASLLGYSLDGADGAFIFSSSSNVSQLKIYDFLADTEVSVDIQGKAHSIAANENKIAVISGGNLWCYDHFGKLLSSKTVGEKSIIDISGNKVITAYSGGVSYTKLNGEDNEHST